MSRRATFAPPQVGAAAAYRIRMNWNAVGNLVAVILLALSLLTWAALTVANAYPASSESPQVGADAPALVFIAPTGVDQGDAFTLPPCPTEDSAACYWDAPSRGDGTGRSYWIDPAGTVHYVAEVAGR